MPAAGRAGTGVYPQKSDVQCRRAGSGNAALKQSSFLRKKPKFSNILIVPDSNAFFFSDGFAFIEANLAQSILSSSQK